MSRIDRTPIVLVSSSPNTSPDQPAGRRPLTRALRQAAEYVRDNQPVYYLVAKDEWRRDERYLESTKLLAAAWLEAHRT